MSSPTPLLDVLDVTSPCPVSWDCMRGDQRARFCGLCQRQVYDLSAMTPDEAESLVREKEGRLCARFYRRADGRILTRDCGRPLRVGARRWLTLAGAAAVLLLSSVFASSENRRGLYHTVMTWLNPPPKTFAGTVTMGIVSMPSPPPSR